MAWTNSGVMPVCSHPLPPHKHLHHHITKYHGGLPSTALLGGARGVPNQDAHLQRFQAEREQITSFFLLLRAHISASVSGRRGKPQLLQLRL